MSNVDNMTHPPSQHTHRGRTQLSIAQDSDGWLYVVCNVCDQQWLADNYHSRKAAYTSDRVVYEAADRRWMAGATKKLRLVDVFEHSPRGEKG